MVYRKARKLSLAGIIIKKIRKQSIKELNKKRPVLGISAGDPAGIGPEITVKALSHSDIYDLCKPMVVCDAGIIKQIITICGLPLKVNIITKPAEGIYEYGIVDVLDLKNVDASSFQFNTIKD